MSGGEPSDPSSPSGPDGPPPTAPKRYVVNDVPVSILMERVQYLAEDGGLITESLRDYTRKTVLRNYAALDDFLETWSNAERKQAVLDELAKQGVLIDELAEQFGREFDPFDLVCQIAYNRPPLTRRERAEKVRKQDVFGRYEGKARAVLSALLDKYADSGIGSVESMEILKVDPLRGFGTPLEIVKLFGGKPAYLAALRDLESALYDQAA